MIKLSIYYEFKDGPWGGSNQFLKALRKELLKQDVYDDNFEKAEILIFGGHPFAPQFKLHEIFNLKQKYPNKIILYRIDGPIFLYRGHDKEFDLSIALICNAFVDGIVFQSHWSSKKNKQFFKMAAPYETVIHNAADKDIFYPTNKKVVDSENKIRLIATSWSSNWKKGFGIYEYLDKILDFAKYEMTFVGNSPIQFKNIRINKPVSQNELAILLRNHDIYITASENDSCSNSVLEAMACGLPVVALNSGGHPELVRRGGELFEGCKDVVEKIEKVAANYYFYQSRLPEFSIESAAKQYYEFAENVYNKVKNGLYTPKRLTLGSRINFYRMKFTMLRWKIRKRLLEMIKR